MAGRKMAELVLSEAERAELKLLSARRKTSQALALRTQIVLDIAVLKTVSWTIRSHIRVVPRSSTFKFLQADRERRWLHLQRGSLV
jgi:hypothetical protein